MDYTKDQIAQMKADEGYNDAHIFHDLRAYYGCTEQEAESIISKIDRN